MTRAKSVFTPMCRHWRRNSGNGAAVSSGMGTCGLVGQIGVIEGWFSTGVGATAFDWIGLVMISFVLPAILTWLISLPLRKWNWIKENDLKLDL